MAATAENAPADLPKRARKRRAKLERAMRRAADAGQWELFRRRRWRYLTSYGVKLAHAAEQNKDLPPHRRLAPDQLCREAQRIQLWRLDPEPVRVSAKFKATGGVRHIHAFGIRRATMNAMVVEAMRPALRFHPAQYAVRGRGGRHAACQALTQAIEEGYRWIVLTDLRDCFGSLRHWDVIETTPLPKAATTNVVLPRTMNTESSETRLPYHLRPDLTAKAVSGLPQGSAASALIVEAWIAETLARLPQRDARVIAYSDNIAIATKTKAEAASMFRALRAAFAAGRTRMLSLRVIRVGRRADYGFEFLGYAFRKRARRVEVRPLDKRLGGFRERFWRSWRVAIVDAAERRRLRGYVKSWSAQFRAWGAADGFRTVMLDQVDRAADLGRRLAQLAPHAVA